MVSTPDTLLATPAHAPCVWLDEYIATLPPAMATMLRHAQALMDSGYPQNAVTFCGENLCSNLMIAAKSVADMDLMADAVAATLLSCLPNYVTDWKTIVKEQCGESVMQLVAGLYQVQKLTYFVSISPLATTEERQQQAEAMRQMLLAMVSDIRVVLIKLAMRAQTMNYLSKVTDEALKKAVAKETMTVFAPLANRLGVWQLKWQLEDLSFRYQNPDEYKKIARLLDEKRTERLDYIEHFVDTLKQQLSRLNMHFEVAGRPKHIYSIYRKMVKKKLSFDGLYDIRAVRILVDTVADCYATLGIVHSLWQPIPGEFDDYIAHPKPNDYQSLHTVVVGPEDKGVEIQIRTFDMHRYAEFGVAAHWRYKEGGKGNEAYEHKIAWLRQLLDWRENLAENGNDREDLSRAFQTELFNDTIYVLSPHGKVFSLPAGATPIDFAYALHTDIGNRCRGAKVDGQIVPLSTPLENGQRVEIITAREGKPSVNWLHDGWVKSNKAISKIRAFIRQQNGESIRESGRTALEKQLVKLQVQPNTHKLAEALGFSSVDDLYLAMGHGEVSGRMIQKAVDTMMEKPETPVTENHLVKRSKIKNNFGGVLVDGEAGLYTTLAKCCKPAFGDDIIGFVTRERGISIHRSNCSSFQYLAQISPDKVLPASWANDSANQVFAIDIEIRARDRSGLLRDISETLARNRLNVTAVQTLSRDLEAQLRFTVEVHQVNDLPRVLSSLSDVKGVLSVTRL
ncbi:MULTISPECIES: bifunctional (p)ppGpp synthetase/guanosine-3',5'-bis(diphosphate) 3'-pyrophosphohydrolase [Snodgrassella]|uniref:RelA/SpoT family protein n=1 Tax=Snodgrassella TaxID=1193515 RepID=UPI0022698DD8|nr:MULTISPECIES: bifunctional (p)ppGpp synthetase/guanosine-3',5'-bis(diphosphate) 3'-pyrophosphohydrolase [unclassified Snodgrassella]MCX8749675.1 bifunctional (p)ppGpp synthetase/guanosine-3',5'-bis(diphosphate) 3'-pyrophosphohydrolase [Snodgrassella sp. B3088]MCX8754160.1 bifunctional (p)ppGpp synthetase/guanosine-3',5'-bis(diphosphate) 3'-pyrophosphohydrolase [Snodgrassella sp. B3837]